MSLSAEAVACALAAVHVLADAGWQLVHERARGLAARLAALLEERGRTVAPRGDSTLVSFESIDPEYERDRLREHGVLLRNIPGAPWLRASVGAWNDEDDLDRLLAALSTWLDTADHHHSGSAIARLRARGRPHAATPRGCAGTRGASAIALVAVLALSAVLNVNRLAQNEYGNTFYSAAVRSMLDSAHNFFFISFDPGGLITVNKPPLALWIQGLSAELFGLHPLSLLLPEAIMGVLTVAAMYWVIAPGRSSRRRGERAGAGGVSVVRRDLAGERVDTVLILLMTLACGVGLRAINPAGCARCSAARCSSGSRSTPRRWPPTWSSRDWDSATWCARRAPCHDGSGSCWPRASCCSSFRSHGRRLSN